MSKLFVSEKKPLKFFMEPNPKLKNLKKQIESNGGKCVLIREPDSIELVQHEVGTPFSEKVSRQIYSYSYIKDCIEAKQLLDLKSYSLLKNSLTKGNRKGYNLEEEEKMRKYVESHAGSALSIKFWEEALGKGLEIHHSADSLKFHWTKVMMKREGKEISIPVKRGNVVAETIVKKAKVEKLFIPDEDEMKNVRVVVRNCSRNFLDFSEINLKCEEEEVDDKFERLVSICSNLANRKCSHQEVLRALVARNGKIRATFEHFQNLLS
jgi:hypothetical protein